MYTSTFLGNYYSLRYLKKVLCDQIKYFLLFLYLFLLYDIHILRFGNLKKSILKISNNHITEIVFCEINIIYIGQFRVCWGNILY